MPLWLKNGNLVVSSIGNPIECDECPCEPPEPETCADCCSFVMSSKEVLVDLGAGGWTNLGCDACETIQGEYTCVFQSSCTWIYQVSASVPFCTGPCGPFDLGFSIVASIFLYGSPGSIKCRWRVLVSVRRPGFLDDNDIGCARKATYESAPSDPTIMDCAETGPWILYKIQEGNEGAGTNICAGLLPETVEVSIAP